MEEEGRLLRPGQRAPLQCIDRMSNFPARMQICIDRPNYSLMYSNLLN